MRLFPVPLCIFCFGLLAATLLLLPKGVPAGDQPPPEQRAIGMETPAEKKTIREPTERPDPAEVALPDEEEAPGPPQEELVADPFEPWNRIFFAFNDRFYFWLFKPVAKGYNAVLPEPVRVSVRNFFHNLTMPVRLVNDVLQGDLKYAGNELVRFGINSTVGLAGLFDLAKTGYQIGGREEDLGLTLGHYGAGNVFYLVLPFLGPSSLRDAIGTIGDGFLTPTNYVTPARNALALDAYEYLNTNALQMGEYEDLKASAIEPYIALRDAYIQHRKSLIRK